jgi:MerR family transcriptional regulator, mercuric resistance operon regulatory protein
MAESQLHSLRIGTLARRAGVGVETIRYYQRRRLIGKPPKELGGQRTYPPGYVERVLFIRRAQALGFSLDDVAALLTLNDGVDRVRARAIARHRIEEIGARISDLQAMRAILERLLHDCEHASGHVPCPIISAIRGSDAALPPQKQIAGAAARARRKHLAAA